MTKSISITAAFEKYSPINGEPHYIFRTHDDVYLISCVEEPFLMSKLSPNDLVKIKGDISTRVSEGIKLVNVEFGGGE